jgi:hypothetical protein
MVFCTIMQQSSTFVYLDGTVLVHHDVVSPIITENETSSSLRKRKY